MKASFTHCRFSEDAVLRRVVTASGVTLYVERRGERVAIELTVRDLQQIDQEVHEAGRVAVSAADSEP